MSRSALPTRPSPVTSPKLQIPAGDLFAPTGADDVQVVAADLAVAVEIALLCNDNGCKIVAGIIDGHESGGHAGMRDITVRKGIVDQGDLVAGEIENAALHGDPAAQVIAIDVFELEDLEVGIHILAVRGTPSVQRRTVRWTSPPSIVRSPGLL